MLKRLDAKRLIWAGAIGLALAGLTGLHAISMVATKTTPQTAVDLFPANGAAHALVAFETFTAEVTNPEELRDAALAGRPHALDAVRRDATNPRAHTVLALAREDQTDRETIVAAASRLNRRELALQGLVLEHALEREDYPEVVETLDQILRVHPTYGREFFPVLNQALAVDETIPVFDEMLNGNSAWHEQYFKTYALGDTAALPNLAALRARRVLADADFDRELIARLVRSGEIEAAENLFTALGGDARQNASGTRRLEWNADFPPFDWLFVDEAGFRAQASLDGQQLELFARPGQGGVIAERIVSVPEAPFAIAVAYNNESVGSGDQQEGGVRIQLRCADSTEIFFDEALERGENQLAVASTSDGCSRIALMINARAFSGRPRLDALLGKIRIIES